MANKVYGITKQALQLAQREVVEEIMRSEYARSVHTVWAGCMIGLRNEYRWNKRKAGE